LIPLVAGPGLASPAKAGGIAPDLTRKIQAHPGLNPNTVKGILMYTALPLSLTDSTGQPLSHGLSVLTPGAGSGNAVGAVEVAGKVDTAAAVGTPWLTASLSKQTTIAGTPYTLERQGALRR
jgi:hypothetical protein